MRCTKSAHVAVDDIGGGRSPSPQSFFLEPLRNTRLFVE
jgi:hypothetical protein